MHRSICKPDSLFFWNVFSLMWERYHVTFELITCPPCLKRISEKIALALGIFFVTFVIFHTWIAKYIQLNSDLFHVVKKNVIQKIYHNYFFVMRNLLQNWFNWSAHIENLLNVSRFLICHDNWIIIFSIHMLMYNYIYTYPCNLKQI